MPTNHDEERTKERGCVIWLAIGLTLLPVAYFLAYGPLIWLARRNLLSHPEVVDLIFWPIGQLCNQSLWFNDFFVWYADLWDPPPHAIERWLRKRPHG